MPKLLKRDKHPSPAAPPEPAAADAGLEDQPESHADPETPAAPTPAPTASADSPAGGDRRRSRRRPAELLARVYGDPGEMSRAERERQAALEFEQAVAPVMDLLVASVPDASSAEEAARAWESRAGELRPDPAGGAYVPGDRYDADARIYYRLLRRDYEKDPRPSLRKKRGTTHHLHTQYSRFPGTKGW